MRMNDDIINPSDNVKYLGVILNDKLRDDDDMSTLTKFVCQVQCYYKKISPLFNRSEM